MADSGSNKSGEKKSEGSKSEPSEDSEQSELPEKCPQKESLKDSGSASAEKDSELSVKSSHKSGSDDYRLRDVFARPRQAAPKHPLFSSPFVRHISARAFGPKKPKWYTPLTSAQLYLFKDLMNYVETGREGHFRFDEFVEALQDFDSGITREEVLSILDSMEKNEFEELDFGKFLFLLAYKDPSQEEDTGSKKYPPEDVEDPGEIEKMLSTSVVTPRQCLILSAISYYVLIASPEEIERYYIANSRRKATVLHYHMEASRLSGLTEKQMEQKQKKAMEHLGPLFAVTGSPYACPVPFVPSTKDSNAKPTPQKSKKRRYKSRTGKVAYKKEDDKTFYDMHYGRLPMPIMKIPENIRKEMRKRCTVIHKDYITKKAYDAIKEYRDRLKKATVLYNQRSLDIILRKGFPSEARENEFIEIFERYMPLKLEDLQNFSLWVKPAGYEMKHDGKPLYPDKFAFGTKIQNLLQVQHAMEEAKEFRKARISSSEDRTMRSRVLAYNTGRKSLPDKVIEAVHIIGNDQGGASVPAITKWILANYAVEDIDKVKILIKRAVKKFLSDGTFLRAKTSQKSLGISGSFVLGMQKTLVAKRRPSLGKINH